MILLTLAFIFSMEFWRRDSTVFVHIVHNLKPSISTSFLGYSVLIDAVWYILLCKVKDEAQV